MPTNRLVLLGSVLFCGLLLSCKDDEGDAGTGTDTDTSGDGTGTSTGDGGTTSSGDDGSSDEGTTSDGGSTLEPCDPLAEDPCVTGLCAGSPISGFYCRPACPDGAGEGDDCGDAGMCLPASQVAKDDLACFEIDDCDLITGAGCDLAAGDNCALVDVGPLATACVPSGGGAEFTPCAPNGMLECGVGLGCFGSELVDPDGPEDGGCMAWCIPGDPLPAGCSQCIPYTDEVGTCAECSVLAQDCPQGSQCHPVNELLGGVCTEYGPGTDGDPCSVSDPAESCQEGYLCIENEDDVLECVQICDLANPVCEDPDKLCIDVGLLDENIPNGQLGLCIETDQPFCDPEADPTTCGPSQQCIELQPGLGLCADDCDPMNGEGACTGNYACLPTWEQSPYFVPFAAGNGACGTGCTDNSDCSGETCLLLDGLEMEGICGVTCTPANPTECDAAQSCVPTPGDPLVGACILGGVSCDPTVPESCVGVSQPACAALDGMPTEGACMPPCFVQDPAGCDGAPLDCHAKTDPIWHSGSCFGQANACDPIAQTGCQAGQTCSIMGGGAFGGLAHVCDDAGSVPEGNDCSSEACEEGLGCVEDTCREFCDPLNDNCTTGVCTDISASLYLPADTIGVCG